MLMSSQMDPLIFTDRADYTKTETNFPPANSCNPYTEQSKPLDQISTTSRRVISGACTATMSLGKALMACTCSKGCFNVPLNKTEPGNILCDECGHSLKDHEDSEHGTTGNLTILGDISRPKETQAAVPYIPSGRIMRRSLIYAC